MPDIQRAIDEVRNFIDSTQLFVTEQVKQAAQIYATACAEANRRLSRCAELIHKGLRSEAIHQAQMEPSLLEHVGQLDFPGAEQWGQTATSHGAPSPPRLNWKLAEELNQAYAQERPLEELLKRHRLLALRRGPLSERLPILRNIADLDHLNPLWDEDVRQYERSRMKEIGQQFQMAEKENDDETILALHEEIKSQSWRDGYPESLVGRIEARAEKSQRRAFHAEFNRLAESFNQAITAYDIASAQRCREEIRTRLAETRLPQDDPLRAIFRDGLSWLKKREQQQEERGKFNANLDELQKGLRNAVPFRQLTELYRKASDTAATVGPAGEQLPAEIEQEYRQRERRARRQRLIKQIAGTAAVVTVLTAVTVFWTIRSQNRAQQRRVADATVKLQEMVKLERYAEAREYLRELSRKEPQTLEDEEIRLISRRVDQVEKVEAERTDRFVSFLRKSKDLPYGDAMEEYHVKEIKRLAVTPNERLEAARFGDDREKARLERQKADQAKKSDDLKGLMEDIAVRIPAIRVAGYNLAGRAAAHKELEDINAKLLKIEDRAGELIGTQPAALEGLRNKHTIIRKSLDQLDKESKAIDMVGLAVSQFELKKFAGALGAAAPAFVDANRRKAFEKAAAELAAWQVVLDWGQLLDEAEPDLLLLRDPTKAAKKAEKILEWCDAADVKPYLGLESAVSSFLILGYVATLQATSKREEAISAMGLVFQDEKVEKVWFIRTKDAKVYYAVRDPGDAVKRAMNTPGLGVRFFKLPRGSGETGTKGPPEAHGEAPQSIVAAKVLRDLKNANDESLDALAVRFIEEYIHPEKNLDSILAVIMISHLLKVTSDADAAFAKEVAADLDKLNKSGLDLTVPWHDPESQDATSVRDGATKFLAKFPSLKDLPDKVKARRSALETRLKQSRYLAVGWLYKDPEIGWRAAGELAKEAKGPVKMLAVKEGTPAGWIVVGKATNGNIVLEPNKQAELVEGRPLFMARE